VADPPAPVTRDARVDALKGFAIVCVVIFHASGQYFSYSPSTGVVYATWAVWLRALLFSFMLPLFACLSGYVLGRPGGFRPQEYFWKRTVGLLVPYLVWETIYGPGRDKHPEMLRSVGAFVGYYAQILANPHYEGRMWYLYVLWIALILLGVARLGRDKTWVLLASVPVVYAVASMGQFHWLRWVYAFVVIGVLWRRFEDRLVPRLRTYGILGAVAFVPLWLLSEPEQSAYARLAAWIRPGFGPQVLVQAFPVLQMVTGLAAVAALYALSYHLPRKLEGGMAFLGVLSLGIYVTHFHFVEMWRAMPWWFLPINVALALAIAIALTVLLGRSRVTALLFLGESWPRRARKLGDVQTETL
jgi:fucose 4-O-acetylase-like acetyltransferase